MNIDFYLADGEEGARNDSIIFWRTILRNPAFDLQERARQVIFQLKQDDQVVGVSTCDQVRIPQLNNNYFYSYRMLINTRYRYPGLADKLLIETYNYLENRFINGGSRSIGMLTLVENPQLLKERRELFYRTSKLMFAGYTKTGRQIRLRYFRGAMI